MFTLNDTTTTALPSLHVALLLSTITITSSATPYGTAFVATASGHTCEFMNGQVISPPLLMPGWDVE